MERQPNRELQHARKLTGLSQGQLARAAGLASAVIVSDIEIGRNKRPAYDVVVRIVRALKANGMPGLEIEDLFPVPGKAARIDRTAA